MPEQQMTARELMTEKLRTKAFRRASEVERIDPDLAHAIRSMARDIGTADERPDDLDLLDVEPEVAESGFGVSILSNPEGPWYGIGEA